MYRACKTLQDKCLIAILAETGLRASEVCSLRWQDIHLNEQKIIVEKAKWGKPHVAMIPIALRKKLIKYHSSLPHKQQQKSAFLFTQVSGKPIDRHGVRQRVERIGRDAGVQGVHPHALRRYCTTSLLRKGLDLHLVKDAIGHESITTTMMYAKTTQSDLIEAMQNLGILK